jgi:hypothetical protein
VWYTILLNDSVRKITKEKERIISEDIGIDGSVAFERIVKNMDSI